MNFIRKSKYKKKLGEYQALFYPVFSLMAAPVATQTERISVVRELIGLIQQHLTPGQQTNPEELANKVESTVFAHAKTREEYLHNIARKHLLLKRNNPSGQKNGQPGQPGQSGQPGQGQPHIQQPPPVPLKPQGPPPIPNSYSGLYMSLQSIPTYTVPGIHPRGFPAPPQYPMTILPTRPSVIPSRSQVQKLPDPDPEYTKKLAELRSTYGQKLKSLIQKIQEVTASGRPLSAIENQHMQKTKQTVMTLAAVLQGANEKTRTLRALQQAEPILQKYFNRQPTAPSNSVSSTQSSVPGMVRPGPTVAPPSRPSPVVAGPSFPTVIRNNSTVNPALSSRQPGHIITKDLSSGQVTQNAVATGAIPSTQAQDSRMGAPKPGTPKEVDANRQRSKPPNVQSTLNSFVDCLCLPNKRPAYLLPTVEKNLTFFENGTSSTSEISLHRGGNTEQSKKYWWIRSEFLEGDKESQLTPLGDEGEEDDKKLTSKRKYPETTEELVVQSNEVLNGSSSKDSLPFRKLAKASLLSFSLERQRTEVAAALKSDSIAFGLDEFDSKEDIKLNLSSWNDVEIKFSPSWDSTLVNDPTAPYLPDGGAHIRLNNKDLSYTVFPGSIVNQISFLKAIERRHSKIEKELQCMTQFSVSYLPPAEDFVNIKIPPMYLMVPIDYPSAPVEYEFGAEYDLVEELHAIRSRFEKLVLSSAEPATIHRYLGCFLAAIK